ncbi:motility associated factor glycosyltransferase family protein [Paenibacillus xylanilyticus]|uniref:motility associated factor glycosyltransferase family protein n=1 Tax=Paenibacillus xylanilyticus TaxID=248903 RepID=UPI0039A1D5CD
MSLKESNYAILRERFSHLRSFEKVIENTPTFSEPIERDEEWLDAIENLVDDEKVIFVYGFERGLGIADLLEQYPDRWFIVHEPNTELFQRGLNDYDITLVLQHPNLHWLSVGEDQLPLLFNILSSYMQDRLVFIAARKYLLDEIDHLRKIKDDFEEYRISHLTNKFTEDRFSREWTQNYLNHLVDAVTVPNIEQLAGRLKNIKTAVVVSSGPSLEDDISVLKQLCGHALIISAGSSIQALQKHGIDPHISVIMDGHAVNERIFSNPGTLNSPLFFTSSSYYQISDQKNKGKIYGMLRNDLVSQYMLERKDSDCVIIPTETVAGTAIQVAVVFGVQQILFVGQDLSFPDKQYYSSGIEHLSVEARSKQLETALITVPNVQGGFNQTDRSFLIMKKAIEDLVRQYSGVEFINTSGRGAVIEGARYVPLETMLPVLQKQPIVEKGIVEKLIEEYESSFPVINDRLLTLYSKIRGVYNEIAELPEQIKKLNSQISDMERYSRSKPAKAVKSFEKIGYMWGDIANKSWFSPLFETLLPIQISNFDRVLPLISNEERLIEKSALVYKHLGELVGKIKEQVPLLLERLDEASERISHKIESSDRMK